MKVIQNAFAILSVALCISSASADDLTATAKKYVNFWQPLEGTWMVTFESEGQASDAEMGPILWNVSRSPTGLCLLSGGELKGTPIGTGLHGYDPEQKCWHFISYQVPTGPDEAYCSKNWLHIDVAKDKVLKEGCTFIAEGKHYRGDGTVTESRARWTFPKVTDRVIEIAFTEGTENGESVPAGKMICKQKTD